MTLKNVAPIRRSQPSSGTFLSFSARHQDHREARGRCPPVVAALNGRASQWGNCSACRLLCDPSQAVRRYGSTRGQGVCGLILRTAPEALSRGCLKTIGGTLGDVALARGFICRFRTTLTCFRAFGDIRGDVPVLSVSRQAPVSVGPETWVLGSVVAGGAREDPFWLWQGGL